MKQTIWKYELEITDRQTIEMPTHAQIITAQMQGNKLCLWALVEPDAALTSRDFAIIGTGEPTGDDVAEWGMFIATVQQVDCVWHVFEVCEELFL